MQVRNCFHLSGASTGTLSSTDLNVLICWKEENILPYFGCLCLFGKIHIFHGDPLFPLQVMGRYVGLWLLYRQHIVWGFGGS
jgi:hypothetical protein